ncbi:hypothetical protein [Horticoccus sp. 23ND18S-11]|uniref:hypothetical protein n=1 Tax=Horticoccus sp. 23ND18S-11 TaxID=3391832 RepID=UPI0039C90D85
MSFIRKNPLFAFALIVCGVLALAELAFIYERFAASRAAVKRLAQRETDLQSMAQLTPPPTRDVAAAIEADLAKAQKALLSMQGELKGRGPAAERIRSAKVPTVRTDAYFDLATFVEKSREFARKNDVEIRPEAARFGFASYTNEGPMQDHIEPVFRQRQIAQYLVEALLEARPRSLFTVKRERTLTKADREAQAAAIANGQPAPEITGEEGPDYFSIDPRVTARAPGFIDTTAFQFVFTGQTAALRTFLNRLASFELPVLVREVEVETATVEESAPVALTEDAAAAAAALADPAAAAATPNSVVLTVAPKPAVVAAKSAPRAVKPTTAVPIVSKPLSKFTVTVEFIELVPPAAPAPADGAAVPPTS